MKTILSLLFLVSFLFFFSSCREDPCSILNPDRCQIDYVFKFDYKTSPIMDTITVGDTFFFEMEIPHMAQDTESGIIYDVSGLPFSGLFLGIWRVNFNDNTVREMIPNEIKYFPIENEGVIEVRQFGSSEAVRFSFVNLADKRYIRFGVVPQIEGYFMTYPFFDWTAQSSTDNGFRLVDTCCIQFVSSTMSFNGGQGGNMEWLGNNPMFTKENTSLIVDFTKENVTRFDPFVYYVED